MYKDNKNTVLIVDDDNMEIAVLTEILSPEYTIYAVKEGREGIKAAESLLPDIILLDVIMPEIDGFEVITALKKSEKVRNIPVIFITGLGETGDEERGLRLGAADYIVKPFSADKVRLRVQNQIKMIRQMDVIIEKELAERISRSQFEFLSRMSHEMLTPMNAIIGMTHIAKRSREMGEIKECIDEIGLSSSYLLELINNLLEVSARNEKELVLNNAPFSLTATLRGIVDAVGRDITGKSLNLTQEIDPSIPMLLIGDKVRLAQVVGSLLDNAIKFTPNGGKIHIMATVIDRNETEVTLEIGILDSGIGISEEKQPEIFNAFSQADSSLTAKSGGAGLGLAVSKQIIQRMGGQIRVESEPGKGSKFTFSCILRHKH